MGELVTLDLRDPFWVADFLDQVNKLRLDRLDFTSALGLGVVAW